ncbi:MAG: SpoIIE family protein phosphatase [Anaerolineae bacterium]|nr:SpoIIE family protein phosphatase [Anaerolineae bacterium]
MAAAISLAAAILWRRSRSRRLLVQQIDELSKLSQAGQAIVAAQIDLDELVKLIAHEVGTVIDNRTFQIGLFEDNLYHIVYWTINDEPQKHQTFDLSENMGVVGWVRQENKPLLVRDFQKELDSLPARPRYISHSPPRSAIFIPLVSNERAIGIMAAQSSQPNRFNEEDMRRLMILANQAAAAIANAYLYAAERKRAAQLELVGEIARKVNAIQDLDEIFAEVVHLTREQFDFQLVSILALDPETHQAVFKASSSPQVKTNQMRINPGQGLIGLALLSQQTVISNNTTRDERYIGISGDPSLDEILAGTHAEMVIPLLIENELLGLLDVQARDVNAFTPQDQMVLEVLAAGVATAIHRARQISVQREQAWLTTAQLQMAEALSHTDSIDDAAATVARLTPMLLGVAQCLVLIWDEEMEQYVAAAQFGLPPDTQPGPFPIGHWPTLDAAHVGQEPLTTHKPPPWPTESANQETSLFPLIAKNQTLGQLVVTLPCPRDHEGREQVGLPPRQLELLRNIASQTAQTIANDQLQQAQQEEAWVNTALLRVAETVNSLIELNEILDTIVRFIPMLVGVQSSLILIWDEETEMFHCGPSYGLSEMGRGIIEAQAIEWGEFVAVHPHEEDSLNPGTAYYTIRLPKWLSEIIGSEQAETFMLHARSNLVGALLIGPTANGRPLTGRRLQILAGIAHQAATAVMNDQLYRESAERSRLERELDVARRIQSSLMPEKSPDIPFLDVVSYWQPARQVSGDFYDFVPLQEGRWGIVIADVADKGFGAALFMALCRTIIRAVAFSRTDPVETLLRANQIICNDSYSDLFVTVFYAIWDPAHQTLTYANGGHNPPLLIRGDGRISQLKGSGVALGVVDPIEIERHEIRLRPQDSLIFYTDGITEAIDETYNEFGISRLQIVAAASHQKSASTMLQSITEAISTHVGETAQFDDITLVILKYLGKRRK